MSEALARVEREVGRDALIIDTAREGEMTVVFARRPEDVPPSSVAGGIDGSVHRVSKRTAKDPATALATELGAHGVSDRVTSAVLRAVRGLDEGLLQRGSRSLPAVVRRVLTGLVRTVPIRGKRVALVGPTGVGKTTTIAKLAARDSLEHGLSTAIVTTDTYRVAAVEQIRAFADMMELPFRVAFTPQDVRRALDDFSDHDRVWIDTSGRNPRDEQAIRGIRGLFTGLEVDVLLCLPAAGRRRDLERALVTFSTFEPSALVACKWDETDVPGELLSLAIERDLAIAGHGTGQRVPEDWEDADARTYARELVPEDKNLVELPAKVRHA
ncbi:MAG: hypothetical protein KDC95_00720 [Planctomycetes bacterium]|nr:hypothetical protein [Planctomycetota bacterium]